MIRPLRQRHRRLVITLGVILPVVFAAGIAARRPVPAASALPPGLAVQTGNFPIVEWERDGLFAKTRIRTRLLREQSGAGRSAVEFATARNFVKPDLIAYWVTGRPGSTNAPPDGAVLLGSFVPAAPLPLPAGAETGGGAILLYSLADQEVVDVSQSLALPKP